MSSHSARIRAIVLARRSRSLSARRSETSRPPAAAILLVIRSRREASGTRAASSWIPRSHVCVNSIPTIPYAGSRWITSWPSSASSRPVRSHASRCSSESEAISPGGIFRDTAIRRRPGGVRAASR